MIPRTAWSGVDLSTSTVAKLPTRGNHGIPIYVDETKCYYVWDDNSDAWLIEGTVCFEYDIDDDGGEAGNIVIGALPANTIVLDGIVDVITAPTADSDVSSSSSSSTDSVSSTSSSSTSSTSSTTSESSSSQSESSLSESVSSSSSSVTSSSSSQSASSESSSSDDDGISIYAVTGGDIFDAAQLTDITVGLHDVVPVGTAATAFKVSSATNVTLALGVPLATGRIAVYLRCMRGLA